MEIVGMDMSDAKMLCSEPLGFEMLETGKLDARMFNIEARMVGRNDACRRCFTGHQGRERLINSPVSPCPIS